MPPEQLPLFSGETALEGSPRAVPGGYLFAGKVYKYDYGAVVARLGKAPDRQLALEIGCQRDYLRRLRVQLGIPAYRKYPGLDRELGKVPDARLARRYGCSVATVAYRRKQRGIPPADPRQDTARRKLAAYIEELRS